MPGTGHKSIRSHQRALVRMHDGTTFVDTFLEDRDWCLVFETRGRVASALVRTVSPYRPLEGSQFLNEQAKHTCVICSNTYQAKEATKMIQVNNQFICRGCVRQIVEQAR
jgi:hypothetical protein